MAKPISIADLRRLARRRLPRMVFDYLEGGAEDESGIVGNIEAFRKIGLVPHRLVDVSKRSTAVELLGKTAAAPLVVGPTGLTEPSGPMATSRLPGQQRRPVFPSRSPRHRMRLSKMSPPSGDDCGFSFMSCIENSQRAWSGALRGQVVRR